MYPCDAEHARRWHGACASDAELRDLSAAAEIAFCVASGAQRLTFVFREGRYAGGEGVEAPAFTLVADATDWARFFRPVPPPAYQNFFGMRMRVGSARVEGSELAMAQHAHLVRRVLEIGRETLGGTCIEPDPPRRSKTHLRAGYVEIGIDGQPVDVFYESAGTGPDVLLLHTAGADGRQYQDLMSDTQLTQRCRLTAFDLPGHGRSDPWPGVAPGAYALTTERYAQTILAVMDALKLQRPVVSGSSMGGEICLEMAYRAAARLSGVIACEASDHVPGRATPWARHPRINQSLFVPEWVDGLMAPQSPIACRKKVWWGYSQGGYATFAGDIDFYTGDWDGRDRVAAIDTRACPVVMMTGEYDYSCTPAMSQATADKIPGAVFWSMPCLGHFPMTENPSRFAVHFNRALDLLGV
ncbi:alpha/beta hydrolase [Salinisphaera sp. T31B1]|uniref:alpha/beta fold hydrolase n=1 Tax=Salinisphaera sp. T31B1 TaxID=727963 RepID=UPI0033404B76